jgi:hypothetical protein
MLFHSREGPSMTTRKTQWAAEVPGQERGLDRRTLLRTALITGAGAVALGAMSVPLADPAHADSFQPNWGFCVNCDEIFWANGANFTSYGSCAAVQAEFHTLGGTNYYTEYGVSSSGNPANPSSSGQQAGWRFCTACAALIWPGTSSASCPKNSTWMSNQPLVWRNHSAGSTNYAVPFGITNNSDYQDGWCYCNACGVLYWAGKWGEDAGVCMTNWPDKHTAGSDSHYQMIFV